MVLTNPPGYSSKKISSDTKASRNNSDNNEELKSKKAWDVALAPFKSLFMTVFMLWMAGTSVQIFSILITGMNLINPGRAIMSTSQAFSSLGREKGQFRLQKITYVIGHLLAFLCGVYKCGQMGLLPTSSSDWLAFIEPVYVSQSSVGGIF